MSEPALKRALQCDSDWCLSFLEASSSICVKVVVELQILKSDRARDVHASTGGPSSMMKSRKGSRGIESGGEEIKEEMVDDQEEG